MLCNANALPWGRKMKYLILVVSSLILSSCMPFLPTSDSQPLFMADSQSGGQTGIITINITLDPPVLVGWEDEDASYKHLRFIEHDGAPVQLDREWVDEVEVLGWVYSLGLTENQALEEMQRFAASENALTIYFTGHTANLEDMYQFGYRYMCMIVRDK